MAPMRIVAVAPGADACAATSAPEALPQPASSAPARRPSCPCLEDTRLHAPVERGRYETLPLHLSLTLHSRLGWSGTLPPPPPPPLPTLFMILAGLKHACCGCQARATPCPCQGAACASACLEFASPQPEAQVKVSVQPIIVLAPSTACCQSALGLQHVHTSGPPPAHAWQHAA